jgi:magnesium-transporting ATPase (P-type)
MKTTYLFPHRFKRVSGVLFVLSFLSLIAYTILQSPEYPLFSIPVFAVIGDDGYFSTTRYFKIVNNPALDELIVLLFIAFGIVYAFAKEKQEDELVAAIRLHSLAWATIINYSILFACYLLIYGLPFFNILMAAMFSQLIIFIIIFRYKMYRFYTSRQDEE